MSGQSYSAQLKVRNSVGDPDSRIIHLSSLLRRYQYCLLPRTLANIVERFVAQNTKPCSHMRRVGTEDYTLLCVVLEYNTMCGIVGIKMLCYELFPCCALHVFNDFCLYSWCIPHTFFLCSLVIPRTAISRRRLR